MLRAPRTLLALLLALRVVMADAARALRVCGGDKFAPRARVGLKRLL